MDMVSAVEVRKWEPDNDRRLAAAVLANVEKMPVVCANLAFMNAKDRDWPVQVNMAAGAFNLNAFPNLTVDPDDFVRTQEVIEQPDGNGEFTRGLAFRVAEKFRGVDAKVENGRLMWAGHTIPWTPARTIAINYAGPPGTFPFIPLSDFIAAARAGDKEKIRQWVAGKAVLLGPDTIDDRHPTPFYTSFSGVKFNTAGVEIHANTLQTLLDGDYLVAVPYSVRVLALLLVAALTAVGAPSPAAGRTPYWVMAAPPATAHPTHP